MNDETVGGVHWSFWTIAAAAALIWNVMGVMNYFVQMNADSLAAYPESHRAIVEGRPAWATVNLMPLVVAAFLVWYSKHAASKGWLSR